MKSSHYLPITSRSVKSHVLTDDYLEFIFGHIIAADLQILVCEDTLYEVR